MSETTSDLKSDVVKLVGEIDAAVSRAEKGELSKTLKVISPFKAEFLKGMKLDYKPETLDFYRKKFDTLHQVELAEIKQKDADAKKLEADAKKLESDVTELTRDIEAESQRASKARAISGSKRLETLKKDVLATNKGGMSREVLDAYADQFKEVKKELELELKKLAGGEKDVEPAQKWTVVDSGADTEEMKPAQDKKYESWKKLIKGGAHPKAAAEEIGDSHFEEVGAGYTIRLSQEHRVFFLISGNKVTVKSIGGHYPKKKK